MQVRLLDETEYKYFELHYDYETEGHYKVVCHDNSNKMCVSFEREKYDSPQRKTNIDTLYQDYWQGTEAYAVEDTESKRVYAYFEICFEEWNNRLRMTQLLVDKDCRGKGIGRKIINYVKNIAIERDYRIIVLETQNYNLPAIDFYKANGFEFCGTNLFFYSNSDIEDDEVMLEMCIRL